MSTQTAVQGVYQQMMAGRIAQMLRIRLKRDYPCVPEISANKYALNIRFTTQEPGQRPKVVEQDVEFELTFCNL
jgi:cell division protein ZapD